jgi:hypothetical protein
MFVALSSRRWINTDLVRESELRHDQRHLGCDAVTHATLRRTDGSLELIVNHDDLIALHVWLRSQAARR